MMRSSLFYTLLILLAIVFAISFWQKKTEPETAPPEPEKIIEVKEFELKPAKFSDLKNWQNDEIAEVIKGFSDSCKKILAEKTSFLSHSMSNIPTKLYQDICSKFIMTDINGSREFKTFIEENFNPYLVFGNGSAEGKFTAYYESALKASYAKDEKYKYPVYGKPVDLIEFNPKDFDKTFASKRFVGRIQNNKLVPYYTRKEIENRGINAPVILWGDCPIDIYIMQIQGSAVADLPDGSTIRIGYADNNGHPFKGIGSILLEKGLLQSGQASMGKIKEWLKNNETALEHMNENQRFIFHQLLSTEGPIGAHGVPLHAGRSLAVDTRYIPLGSLLWLETTLPSLGETHRLVVAQDVGSAIKGAVRGDYFWGSGKDEVLELAGQMNSKGRYFIMLPKSMELEIEQNN